MVRLVDQVADAVLFQEDAQLFDSEVVIDALLANYRRKHCSARVEPAHKAGSDVFVSAIAQEARVGDKNRQCSDTGGWSMSMMRVGPACSDAMITPTPIRPMGKVMTRSVNSARFQRLR